MAKPCKISLCKSSQKIEIGAQHGLQLNGCQMQETFWTIGISEIVLKSTANAIFESGNGAIRLVGHTEIRVSGWRNAKQRHVLEWKMNGENERILRISLSVFGVNTREGHKKLRALYGFLLS